MVPKVRICQRLVDELYDQAIENDTTVTSEGYSILDKYFVAKKEKSANDE